MNSPGDRRPVTLVPSVMVRHKTPGTKHLREVIRRCGVLASGYVKIAIENGDL